MLMRSQTQPTTKAYYIVLGTRLCARARIPYLAAEMSFTEKDHLLNSSIRDKDKENRLSWLTKLWRTNCCPWIKCRVVITIMCFLGFCNVYALRVNLSLAIVVMVNGTEAVSQPHKVLS